MTTPDDDARPDDPPGLIDKALGLGLAFARQLAAGNPAASHAVQDERRAICEACPRLVAGTCIRCGCTAMDLKRSWATMECPEGHWPSVA